MTPEFTHLHVHTQYSILDGAADIGDLLDKAKSSGMKALAITDHGNMYGVLKFYLEAVSRGVKPIIGCEIYVAETSRFDKRGREDRSGFHLILLAKNLQGYRNLCKLSSKGFLEGFYYTPRIDKELLREYHEGLIASSACLGGEIPSAILASDFKKAQSLVEEYRAIFGEDFYLELMDHGLEDQLMVNKALLQLARKNGIRVVATNDVHFVEQKDFEAHRILICLNTGKELSDASGLEYTGKEYLRTPEEMAELFREVPEAIATTQEILAKIEAYDIRQKIIVPRFPLPEGYASEDEYLRRLAYKGAEKKYGDSCGPVKERLDFELTTISRMGYPGYFLIVQDFINHARNHGITVGPGRGSAAGSVVAYCTGITNIDPIRYNLLFERFLNPERVTYPDIDVDFDDAGRDEVIRYVVNKYGESRVAQIVTFNTMGAKSAIRDVARVLKLPLPEADRLAKLVPERPGETLKHAYREVPELEETRNNGPELARKTLEFAEVLEGSARHTGTHAAGVIIGPDDLINFVPLGRAKDTEFVITQYEGKLVESAGMLKMDFLGLKTLSIIKDAIENIHKKTGQRIAIDDLDWEDQKTFELYQKGDTIATFQFESDGMRNYLKDLRPNCLEDLIAMNALYRPGPMDFIATYIRRKHGKEKTEYPHPLLEDILKPTYGIMVYQEQIMQAAQILAGFSLGKADILRRAMGKKDSEKMLQQKALFVEGAGKNDIPADKAGEIFSIMQEFAKYGFNRSHSAAYSVIAYQTAFLKAHYPAEYMAAVLTHNLSDIKKITFFIEECKRHNIPVLGPDVNESDLDFTVNSRGEIRFGLAAIKNVGESAAQAIISERNGNGSYRNVFDFIRRVNLRTVNKRSLEALASAGAFDCFENTHRAQFFFREDSSDTIYLEKIIHYASAYQEKKNAMQVSLFGAEEDTLVKDPDLPACDPWTKLEQLKKEKEVTGFYISGHPLEDFEPERKFCCNVSINDLKSNLKAFKTKTVTFAGLISTVAQKTGKTGNLFGTFTLEDYNDSIQLLLFSEEYLKLRHFLVEGNTVHITGVVQPRKKDEQILDVMVRNITLLTEVLEKTVRCITLEISLDVLDAGLIATLRRYISEADGNCELKLKIFDAGQADNGMSVTLPSKKFRVNPSAFIRLVENMKGIKYRLQ